MDKTITIKHIRSGQPRAYADSCYESVITFSGGTLGKWTPPEMTVKALAQVLVRSFVEPKDSKCWVDSVLKEIKEESPGVWRIVIVEPYMD